MSAEPRRVPVEAGITETFPPFSGAEREIPMRERKLHPDACRDLARNGFQGNVMYVLVWVAACLSINLYRDAPWLGYGGTAAIGCFVILRSWLALRFDSLFGISPARWYGWYQFSVYGLAVSFSFFACFAIWIAGVSWSGFLLVAASVGIAAAARITLQTHLGLQNQYTLLTIIPIAGTVILQGDPGSIIMGVVYLIYGIYLRIFGKQSYEQYWSGLENELLLKERASQLELARKRLKSQNRELLEAAELREDIDRIMRHDLKGPLSSIIGYSQLILSEQKHPEKVREYCDQILDGGYRMLDMVNASFDLLKMERGQYEFEPRAIPIEEVLFQLARDFGELMRHYRCRVQIVSEPESAETGEGTPHVWGDEALCHTLFSNLIRNAIEACSRGGVVQVLIARGGGEVEVRIRNPGEVPQAIRERFFEKYSTSGKKGGIGLGTYSAQLMTRTQGGVLELNTEEAGYTELIIRLPAASVDKVEPVEPEAD